MSRMTLSALRTAIAVGSATFLLAGLVACSPTAQDDDAASNGSTSSSTSKGTEKDLDDWRLSYAQCMRDQGIDYPDPDKAGGQTITMTDGWDEAAATCEEKLGKAPAGSGEDADTSDNPMLEIAQCLREKGYDIEDPKPGAAGRIPDNLTDEDAEACGIQLAGGN